MKTLFKDHFFCGPVGMNKKITNKIEEISGIAYEPNQVTPFTGLYESFYLNGQKQIETPYVSGLKQGLETGWHANGNKKFEVNYVKGLKQGLYRVWFLTGQKREETHYLNGRKSGLEVV